MDRSRNKEEEINKAILEWLTSKNYKKSAENFSEETSLHPQDATKGNQLEKRWGTILIMQKKITDNEAYIKQLKEDLEKASLGGTTINPLKQTNESMVK